MSEKCPRCNSVNTKFCYFNNRSLLQPRFYCKTCRRYWTQGGALRDIPIGGTRPRRPKHPNSASSSSSSSVAPPSQPPPQRVVHNKAISNSLPITNTYHQGGEVGIMSSLAGVQSLSASSQHFNQFQQGGVNTVGANLAMGSSSSFTISLPQSLPPQEVVQNWLVSPSPNPISQSFNQLISLSPPSNQEMNPISQSFNLISPPFTPISCFNAVDDSSESQVPQPNQVQPTGFYPIGNNAGGIESMFRTAGQVLTQPSVVASSHWQQPQSFINNYNDLATTSNPLSDMFNYNPNIMGNFDQNITLPSNWPEPPDLGLPK